MNNWLKKYQQGGATYNPGNETTLQGINMYNPWQVTNPNMSLAEAAQPNPWATNNPNSEETMNDVYAGRDLQQEEAPQDSSYLKTTTKRTFGNPNWGYIAASNMVGEGLGFLANQGRNSSQNAIKRYNDRKVNPLNTLMANPNTSAQDQAGSGYYKKGGWVSKYQDGGEIDDDEEYLFGFDDIEQEQETPEVTYSKRKNLQAQYSLEDQQNQMRQMQQENFFASLINSDPKQQSDNYSQYNNSTPSEKFVPEEREKQAYNFFKQKGLPDHIAAGIVGNIKYESNFNVSGVGDGGKARGLAQWHPDRYNRLQKQGFNMNSFEGNLEAIAHELTTSERGAYESLMRSRTPQEAATVFDRKYERSAGLSTSKRAARAAQILNSYQQGGIIDDPMGQWNHPGKITRIPSNQITMENVSYPVLGVSQETGEEKLMLPERNYNFKNTKNVIEYPWISKY